MNEKLIEKKLRESVKKKGGLALKFASPFYTGMPDRIVFMPGAVTRFAEIKSTGNKLTDRQEVVKRELENLGFTVSVIDDEKTLNDFLNAL